MRLHDAALRREELLAGYPPHCRPSYLRDRTHRGAVVLKEKLCICSESPRLEQFSSQVLFSSSPRLKRTPLDSVAVTDPNGNLILVGAPGRAANAVRGAQLWNGDAKQLHGDRLLLF